jgi:hypothetical protein
MAISLPARLETSAAGFDPRWALSIGDVVTGFWDESGLAPELVRWLPPTRTGPLPRPADLAFDLAVQPPPPAPRWPPFAAWGGARLWREREAVILRVGEDVGGRVDLATGLGVVWVIRDDRHTAWRAIHQCLRPLWLLAIGRRGLFQVHAASVEVDVRAILIVGPRGAGKSSMALRLKDAGAGVLSDDVSILEARRAVIVHGIGDVPRVRRDALEIVRPGAQPECEEDPDGKMAVGVSDPHVRSATPGALVFIDGEGNGAPELRPIDPAVAMGRLMSSALVGLDPDSDAARMRALARLSESCRAFVAARTVSPAALLATVQGGTPPRHSRSLTP